MFHEHKLFSFYFIKYIFFLLSGYVPEDQQKFSLKEEFIT